GQNCLGVQRIFVQENIYKRFKQQFVAKASQYKMGDKKDESTDKGPLISEKAAKRVEKWVDEAVKEGANELTGGYREEAFYATKVRENITAYAKIAKEEIFSPVVILYSVKRLEDAIEQKKNVNSCLQAGIFTQNIQQAFTAIGWLEVGGIFINDSSDYRIAGMPFGGVKGSGIGREGVKFTIQNMVEPKVVQFKL